MTIQSAHTKSAPTPPQRTTVQALVAELDAAVQSFLETATPQEIGVGLDIARRRLQHDLDRYAFLVKRWAA